MDLRYQSDVWTPSLWHKHILIHIPNYNMLQRPCTWPFAEPWATRSSRQSYCDPPHTTTHCTHVIGKKEERNFREKQIEGSTICVWISVSIWSWSLPSLKVKNNVIWRWRPCLGLTKGTNVAIAGKSCKLPVLLQAEIARAVFPQRELWWVDIRPSMGIQGQTAPEDIF